MIKIPAEQKHDRVFWICSWARFTERASFYGLRSFFVLYLLQGLLMEENEAMLHYSILKNALIVTPFVGGLLGDCVVGNKRAILIGGIMQAIGMFIFCIFSKSALYAGLIFVAIGNGLFTANLLSGIGKLYLNKSKLMDAGYSILYVTVMIGAMMGQFFLPIIAEANYRLGFVTCGILPLVSVFLVNKFYKEDVIQPPSVTGNSNNGTLTIILAILILGLFWALYNVGNCAQISIESKLPDSSTTIRISDFIFGILVGVGASITWSFVYMDWVKKWAWGFLMSGAAFGILLWVGETSPSLAILLPSYLMISVAEILIAPILYAVLAKNSNPKYLATLVGVSFIPTMLSNTIFSYIMASADVDPFQLAWMASISFLVIGVIILVVSRSKKKVEPSAS